jgi:hypothetical protein
VRRDITKIETTTVKDAETTVEVVDHQMETLTRKVYASAVKIIII